MACVWKHPKSSFWYARFTGERGQRVNRSTKQEDRKDAQIIADEWERMAKKANACELTKAVILKTLGEMMERTTGEKLDIQSTKQFFTEWLASKGTKGAAGSTVKRYTPILDGFVEFLGERRASGSVASVTSTEISRFHENEIEQGKAPSTADYAVKVLSAVFSTAVRRGMMLSNPATAVDKIGGDADERIPFTDKQIKSLLAVADNEWTGMILFGLHTGIRLHDGANLTWGNIDLPTHTVTFREGKTAHRKRTISKDTVVRLHPDIVQWLGTQPPGVGMAPLFPGLYGKPAGSHGGLSNAFNRLMERAKIIAPLGEKKTGKGRQFRKLGFHSFRHTIASRLANEDVPADVRKQMLGHSSDEVHRRYVHMDLSAQDRAIAKLKSALGA